MGNALSMSQECGGSANRKDGELKRITIGCNSVGIVGLIPSLEEGARTSQGKSDDEIKKVLFPGDSTENGMISQKNGRRSTFLTHPHRQPLFFDVR